MGLRIRPTERDISNLSRKIITILGSLTNIDHIIVSTRDTLEEVNNLKNRAERARYHEIFERILKVYVFRINYF